MKRKSYFLTVTLLLAGAFVFAEKAMLIDFSLLNADIIQKLDLQGQPVSDKDGNPVYTQNKRTTMDYSVAAGATFTDDQKALMKTSLAMPEWEVVLNSSAKNVSSMNLSRVVEVKVQNPQKEEGVTAALADKAVMGVRVVFPVTANNANAKIVPPFEIPAYEPYREAGDDGVRTGDPVAAPDSENRLYRNDNNTLFEGGYGLVKNVGAIKSISVTTMGMNFPHGLYVMLKDTDDVERRYFMGYLGFDGWRTLQWNNPSYITEIRNREIRVVPIYPRGLPFVKFTGFQVTRDAAHVGGDFIGYFKDVQLIYDRALLSSERDIRDEDVWGIIGYKETLKQQAEMLRFGDKQVDRYLEKVNMATDEAFTSDEYAKTQQ
ncbi:flagellar protein [Treponema parvum]|uniref:Flagellar protein n=1 Tax=Treponema parvum TaxID=138851 RepID=A0A975EZT7_9SPIR|nr:flagellar filament outer layer protein FlaA [Treponema parvum]QTQ11951.1 flagellar protein [Treponema parvum]